MLGNASSQCQALQVSQVEAKGLKSPDLWQIHITGTTSRHTLQLSKLPKHYQSASPMDWNKNINRIDSFQKCVQKTQVPYAHCRGLPLLQAQQLLRWECFPIKVVAECKTCNHAGGSHYCQNKEVVTTARTASLNLPEWWQLEHQDSSCLIPQDQERRCPKCDCKPRCKKPTQNYKDTTSIPDSTDYSPLPI